MIKAIITDVDGVIVGKKKGVNFPLPNKQVIQKFRELHNAGLPIVLCTGKFKHGILEIIKQAKLGNPHITDGGALIIDPLSNKIIKKNTLDKNLVQEIISTCIENEVYIECYGIEEYFVHRSQICDITEKHTLVIQKGPKIVDDLAEYVANLDIIKIMTYSEDEDDKKRVESILSHVMNNINFVWGLHPTMLPVRLNIITTKGVSKEHASLEVLEYLNISPDETLGISDTLGDWNFMEICKYAATVGDESQELKDLVKTKGTGNYFYASSVDENGILDIFNFFNL